MHQDLKAGGGHTTVYRLDSKVEKILKGSLELIQSPSPSVKIQINVGESLFEV